jgi:cation-transporting ATPase 13A3/4/5
VFGPNLINIREKPTSKLLTDEVLNPFYVFQIGSILLWCMDDYYYYAFCIFIISAFSIISTLIETKQVKKKEKNVFMSYMYLEFLLDYEKNEGYVIFRMFCKGVS